MYRIENLEISNNRLKHESLLLQKYAELDKILLAINLENRELRESGVKENLLYYVNTNKRCIAK